jgi:hypothetical protein
MIHLSAPDQYSFVLLKTRTSNETFLSDNTPDKLCLSGVTNEPLNRRNHKAYRGGWTPKRRAQVNQLITYLIFFENIVENS